MRNSHRPYESNGIRPDSNMKLSLLQAHPRRPDKVLLFDFTGIHRTVGLHIRRAVAEFLDDPSEHYKPADVILSLSGEAWAKLYLSQATVQELVKTREIEMKRGSIEEANLLIGLFDKYRPEKAVLVAPHLHDQEWLVVAEYNHAWSCPDYVSANIGTDG